MTVCFILNVEKVTAVVGSSLYGKRLIKLLKLFINSFSSYLNKMTDELNKMNDESDEDKLPTVTMEALEELDYNVISDMPWAQQLCKDIENHMKKGVLNWCKIIKGIAGTKGEHIEKWRKLYCQEVDRALCVLVSEALQTQGSTINKIQTLLTQLEGICKELHQPIPQEIGKKNMSLLEEQDQLMKHVKQYEVVIDAKKKELEVLKEKQRILCKHLGQEPKITLQYPPLPTPAQLEEFQKHVEQLDAKKFEREEQYCQLKHTIMEYVEELKYKPNSDFERKVLSSDTFLVTSDNMKKLEMFAKFLKEIKKSTEEEISHLRSRIEDLWKILDVDLRDRDEFRTHYTGNSLASLDALRLEMKRCEEIGRANMKKFIEKLRTELKDMWDKCHCTDVDKRSFQCFYSDCYTEDLLELHDLEIKKWKTYYEENGKILGLLEKHKELWEKLVELEEKATGPNRYNNRGGKLLQEEKERNTLFKLIPKIEREILELADAYAEANGVPFFSFGLTAKEHIDHMYAERENNRKLKLSARKMQRENTVRHTPGKSATNLFPSTSRAVTPTTHSTIKRKVLATPNTDNVKRLRMATPRSANVKPICTPVIVPKIKITHATLTLPSQKRRSRTSMDKSKRRRSNRKNKSIEDKCQVHDNTRNTTYSDFQNELSSKDHCRSTINSDEIFQAASSSKKRKPTKRAPMLKTPIRTPMAPKTPQSRTPNSASKARAKLATCKTNLKLLF